MSSNTGQIQRNPLPFAQYCDFDKWYPNDRVQAIKNIASGIFVGLAVVFVAIGVDYVLETYFPGWIVSQDALNLFNLFKNAHPLINCAWKATLRVYIVILGPVIEEICFRGCLDDSVEKCQKEEQTLLKKIIRVALVAMIFGACHLSPFQDTFSNCFIMAYTSILGLSLGILKEWTKNLYASTAAHMTLNLAATL